MPEPRSPRVISLVPSATEILCAIGGDELLVGRSHECDFPPSVSRLPPLTQPRTRYDSPAQVDAEVRAALNRGESLYLLETTRLAALKPDVVLTQDLCEVCSIDVAAVRRAVHGMEPAPEVVCLNPTTLDGVLDDFLTIGRAVGLEAGAEDAVVHARDRLYGAAEHVTPFLDGPNVAFLEWTDPLFVGGHWTPQLIERAGGRHPLNPTTPHPQAGAGAGPVGETLRAAGKSVAIPPDVFASTRPDVIIICPCGLPLPQARAAARALRSQPWWRDLPAVRHGRVAIVDGNQMFNRPGPRLVDAFEFLVGYLNDRPRLIPERFPWEPLASLP